MSFGTIQDEIELLSSMDVEAQQQPKTVRASTSARDAQARALYLHNSRNLPNCLPPEILGEIFRAFRSEDYSYCLLSLTHVCRHWRAVATGDPRLWCKPAHSNPKLVTEIIRRSKGTGLHLVLISNRNSQFQGPLPPRGQNWNEALRIQLANVEQAVSIKLDINSWTIKRWQLQNLHKPAPLLESLHIYDAKFLHSDADLIKLFQGHAPRLQRLFLHNCDLLCAPSLFRNLRSLNMEMKSVTCSKLLTVLSSAPLLERLTIHSLGLKYSEGEMTGVVRERPEIVSLPHLRKLSVINGSLDACVHMISHLHVAQPISLVLEKIAYNVRTEQLPLAVQVIDSLITGGSTILPKAASISLDILPGLRLHSSKIWYRDLSLSGIRALRITLSNDDWCLTDIPELLGAMTQVETLQLSNNFAMQMIPMLATKQRAQRPGHPGLFPSLTCLRTSAELDNLTMMEDILTYVRERCEEGAPIRHLGVHRKSFPDVDIEAEFACFVTKLSIF